MRKSSIVLLVLSAAGTLAVGTALALPITANAESPRLIPYSGHLDQAGTPVNGGRTMQISIVDAGDTPLWESASRTVAFVNGAFSMVLGEAPDPAIPDAAFSTEEIYVAVTVEGTPLVGRQRLYSQPYAIRATSAYEASVGGPLSDTLTDLQAAAGSGVKFDNTQNVGGAQDKLIIDPLDARVVGPNGAGDYVWSGLTTCDAGRILTLGNLGNGVLSLVNNACGGASPCFPFLTSSGASIVMFPQATVPPVTFVCHKNSWHQM